MYGIITLESSKKLQNGVENRFKTTNPCKTILVSELPNFGQ
jgi:hypothetical protein